jgi:hypothetical protein
MKNVKRSFLRGWCFLLTLVLSFLTGCHAETFDSCFLSYGTAYIDGQCVPLGYAEAIDNLQQMVQTTEEAQAKK